MANGSYRLDMKRDDARTLMMKMDARLTFAGRERNAAYRLEGERELRHLDYARHLLNADFNRTRREIERRLDYFRALKEENRERRQRRGVAWCDEEAREWDRQARAARRRRTLPRIRAQRNHRAEAVGSIRRDQRGEFANKMSHERHMNRSLDELGKTYARQRAAEDQEQGAGEAPGEGQAEASDPQTSGENLPAIKPSPDDRDEPTKSVRAKYGMPTQVLSLPDLPAAGKPAGGPPTKKNSLSQMISSGEVCKLPGMQAGGQKRTTAGAPPKLSLARTFYMNTSSTNQQGDVGGASGQQPAQEGPAGFGRSRRRVSIVKPSGDDNQTAAGSRSRRRFSLVDPATHSKKRVQPGLTGAANGLGLQQQVPLRFYEIEENPFLKEGGDQSGPDLGRNDDLIRSAKADEMYVWLGFDSEEEYERLRRGELVLELDEEAGAADGDGSDTESNADREGDLDRDRGPGGQAPGGGNTGGRAESKLGAPRILIASAAGDMKPLEKFASAARMVMIVRQFQTNAIK